MNAIAPSYPAERRTSPSTLLPSAPDRILIWTDGSCRGNPGPGGWAYAASFDGKARCVSGSVLAQTSNIQMELLAVGKALASLKRRDLPVTLYTDLMMIVQGMNEWRAGWIARNWKNVAHRQLWEHIIALADGHEAGVTFEHVPGHSGIVGNEEANRLACAASADAVKRVGLRTLMPSMFDPESGSVVPVFKDESATV